MFKQNLFYVILFFLFLSTPLSAQRVKPSFDHSIGLGASTLPTKKLNPSAGLMTRVLAIMVEFQPDNDRRTTGTGIFGGLDYLANRGDTILDPYPHDIGYFSRKLEFLKNYFETTSDGKVKFELTILPNVFRLSKPMADYAPPRNSSDFTRLAQMIEDSWRLADSLRSDIDFSQYDCYIIFHAGVGRDIDLVSLTGTDPAPSDLPSLTFKLDGFKRIFGSDFSGFVANNGASRITNTLVIPSTEAREIDAIGGKVLLELSTNGLLCASFGSFLGLPDLFNTQTGRSGIGRFGLMDGESFFNYNGALPPEPSAWERVFLGWASPINIQGVNTFFKLTAQGLHRSADSAIAKIAMSSREYFLLENRQRNASGEGVTLTFFRNGQIITQTYTQDTDDFRFENLNALNGQIIASSNFDWTLPTLEANNTRYNGGVLIWHIDEDIIESNFASNRVNSNPKRGVRLLEADGSEDIGQDYGITDPGLGTQSGIVLDMFFRGNFALPYRNFVDESTYPNTRSNRGATSKIKLSNFPFSSATMDSIRLERGDNLVRVLNGFPVQLNDTFGIRSGISLSDSIRVNGENRTYSVSFNGGISSYGSSNKKLAGGKVFISRLFAPTTEFDVIVSVNDSLIELTKRDKAGVVQFFQKNVGSRISTPPVISQSGDDTEFSVADVSVGTMDGRGLTFNLDSLQTVSTIAFQSPIVSISGVPFSTGLSVGRQLSFFPKSIFEDTETLSGLKFINKIFDQDHPFSSNDDEEITLTINRDKSLRIRSNKVPLVTVQLPVVNDILSLPAVAELENRGELAVVFTADDKIFAYNLKGFPISNFPISTNSTQPIRSSPIIADVDGDTFADIMVQTGDGRLMAFNRFGKNLFSLPISVGTETTPSVVLSPNGQGLNLYSIDKFGLLQGYSLPNASQVIEWGALYSDALNANTFFQLRTYSKVKTTINEFLPDKFVYNYPNPASTETAFRFFLKESGIVSVKVFDMTGSKIWEASKQSAGGFDDEILWNVRGVQSGIYYGVLTAKSSQGGIEKTIKLKIAVVK